MDDLHAAFKDPQVAAILIGVGGTHAIELLPWLDFELIRAHPKPIYGFSDATILLNAIYAVTGMTTYYGPLFFSFAVNADLHSTLDYWQRALFSKKPYALTPAARWGNYMDLNKDLVNEGYQVVREGNADGKLVGGHLPSLKDELKASLLSRENLKHLPVVMNVDFGHTTPMVPLPIGGRISIDKEQLYIE